MRDSTTSASAQQKATADRSAWPLVDSVHVGYLTLRQAADYLNCSPKTVRRRIKSHGLPHYFVPGSRGIRGQLLFRRGELDRWVRRFKNGLVKESHNAALDTPAKLG